MERNHSLDTMRVIAGFAVVTSHFGYNFLNSRLQFIPNSYGNSIGNIGVTFFFFISGYLAYLSFSKKKTRMYYIDRAVRILTPYIITYFTLSGLMILIYGLTNKDMVSSIPVYQLITTSGNYLSIIPTFFGLDGILNAEFHTGFLFFIGEWFIGCVIFLYLITPLLYRLLESKINNIVFFVILVVLSFPVYQLLSKFLDYPFWVFLCRIPEFFLGMMLCKDKNLHRNKSLIISSIFLCLISIFTLNFRATHGGDNFKFNIESSQVSIIPLMCIAFLVYSLLSYLNEKYDLSSINKLAPNMYICMLIQHVIINLVLRIIKPEEISIFGYVFALSLVFCLILCFSKKIIKTTSTVEKNILNRFK